MTGPIQPKDMSEHFHHLSQARTLYKKGYKFEEGGKIRPGHLLGQLIRFLARLIGGVNPMEFGETMYHQVGFLLKQLAQIKPEEVTQFLEHLKTIDYKDNPEGLKDLNELITYCNYNQKVITEQSGAGYPDIADRIMKLREALVEMKTRAMSQLSNAPPKLVDLAALDALHKEELTKSGSYRPSNFTFVVDGQRRTFEDVDEVVKTLQDARWSNSDITSLTGRCQACLDLALLAAREDLSRQMKSDITLSDMSNSFFLKLDTRTGQVEATRMLVMTRSSKERGQEILGTVATKVVLKPNNNHAEISYRDNPQIDCDPPFINKYSDRFTTLNVDGTDYTVPLEVEEQFRRDNQIVIGQEIFSHNGLPGRNSIEDLIKYCCALRIPKEDIEKYLEVCQRFNTMDTVQLEVQNARNQEGIRRVDFPSPVRSVVCRIDPRTRSVWVDCDYGDEVEALPPHALRPRHLNLIFTGIRFDPFNERAVIEYSVI